VQEALNNAIKYANLDLIHFFLGKSENKELILKIKDSSIGVI
jgi:signal transduction histidine kinase